MPGSGKNWALAMAAYIACWVFWIFGVFILYEVVYSFARRWRISKSLPHLIWKLCLTAHAFQNGH